MPSEKLQVILELVTGQYKREAIEASTATGRIGDSAVTANSQVGRMATGMGRAGSLIKAGFAAIASGAILEVIGNLDQLGQKMESTERMADTVFGEMVESARQWADENNEAFGIGENAMLGLIAKTQDLLVPMGFVREEAFDMSKEILNTANALSEWEGGTITTTDAQLRLAKAMLGETEGLVELGVKLSQADINARLAEKGMDGLTGAALQQAKAQVTLELVMERSSDALAAYETRAGSATAAQKDLAAATADSAESWADIFRPAIDQAKGTMSDVADIGAFLSEKMAEQADQVAITGQKTEGLVDVWEVATPIGALLALALERIADATKDSGAAALDMKPPILDLNASYVAQAVAAGAAEGATVSLGDAIRALTDPAFAAFHSMNQLEDAQREYVAALLEHGPASEEAERAALALGEAVVRANASAADFAEQGGPASVDALLEILTNAGVAADTIARIRDAILDLNATPVDPKNFPFTGGGAGGGPGVFAFQHGGVVPGRRGEPVLAMVHAGETVLPTHGNYSMPIGSMSMPLPPGWSRPNVTGPTIHVHHPNTINLAQDLQLATILATVTNMVEVQS